MTTQVDMPAMPETIQEEPIPIAWPTVRLSDGLISNIQTGFACGKNNRDGLGIVHVRPMNVTSEGTIDLSNIKYVSFDEADRDERLVRTGDVIFNNTNSPELVGKTALYVESEPRAFSNHMTRLRVNPERIRPRFLAFALHQLWRQGYFAEKCNNHVSQASIGRSVLLATEIPVPPLTIQDSLLIRVSELLEPVRASKAKLSNLPITLTRFRRSVLAAACCGDLTSDWRKANRVTREWDHVALGTLIEEKPKNGYSAKPVGFETPWRVLTLTATTGGQFDERQFKFFDEAIPEESPFWVRDGDILIQRGNTLEYVGVSAIYRGKDRQFIFPDLMMRIRANDQVSTEYLALALSETTARNYLRANATGTQGSMPKINQPTLISLPIPLPRKEEQFEIVRRVESLFALANAIEHRLATATGLIDRTIEAVLNKAFAGEL